MSPQQRLELRLKKERKDISNLELSKHLNVSPSLVCSFFKNRRNMKPELIQKMKVYIDNKVVYMDIRFPVK